MGECLANFVGHAGVSAFACRMDGLFGLGFDSAELHVHGRGVAAVLDVSTGC